MCLHIAYQSVTIVIICYQCYHSGLVWLCTCLVCVAIACVAMVTQLSVFYIYLCMCTAVSTNVVTHPVDATAAAPYSVVFTCSIYGYGYQNITWHREANKLPHNHQIKEISSPRIITTTLIIPNVTEQDVGKYYCQIWANNMRTQTDRANLHYAGNILYY